LTLDAIGGLSGGEDKDSFWKIVSLCTDFLPENKPRYCMGIGYALDLVVCSALGVDMYDCVFPTRTARFGNALTPKGSIRLKLSKYRNDMKPIDENCTCFTCKNYSRAYLKTLIDSETVGCILISIHNIAYQMSLMKNIRESIMNDTFPEFVNLFMQDLFPNKKYPAWAVEAFNSVNINLK
jgi:tRNA-guanine family transglycosylase